MCRHTGLLVCFACLFLSAHTSSDLQEDGRRAEAACSAAKLFEKHNVNGSLSLEALDQIMQSVKHVCSSYWKEKEPIHSHEDHSMPHNNTHIDDHEPSKANAWLYAGLSVLFISGCGLAAVAIIKVLPAWLFQPAIQFLVALAIGTLTGDALLHLIPHAFATHHTLNDHGHDRTVVWKGVVALSVMALFFVVERLLNIFGEWRQRLQSTKQVDKVAHILSESSKMVGEKLCRHHQHSHQNHEIDEAKPTEEDLVNCVKLNGGEERDYCPEWEGLVVGKPLIYCASHEICDGSKAHEEPVEETPKESLTVFISEHHTSHHGHSHAHGHIHARPDGVASLAWLVLAGDGMHNLSDGLAIGAAFGANITGGFTTAIAVLCHELPHELGDFAVLLKAGMTIKQAMICNLISSFLCLLGVLIGLAIGSAHETAPWIFASTGGMFLYIALVDMMPELNGHLGKNRSAFLQLFLQLAGIISGFGIMLTIALYEDELNQILSQL